MKQNATQFYVHRRTSVYDATGCWREFNWAHRVAGPFSEHIQAQLWAAGQKRSKFVAHTVGDYDGKPVLSDGSYDYAGSGSGLAEAQDERIKAMSGSEAIVDLYQMQERRITKLEGEVAEFKRLLAEYVPSISAALSKRIDTLEEDHRSRVISAGGWID